jgi:peptidoglycan DL-endopeptidase CwlO
MGTINSTAAAGALAVLTAPGAPLSNPSSLIPQSVLDSASPTDLATISTEASALSETSQLYDATTSALYGSASSIQTYNPSLSLLDASYGLTSSNSSANTPDLLQEGLANLYGATANVSSNSASTSTSSTSSSATASANSTSPSALNQSLLSLYGLGTNNNGNLINTTG